MLIRPLMLAFAAALSMIYQVAAAEGHFQKRIADMKAELAALPTTATGNIVMLGDSITEGFFVGGDMPPEMNGRKVINQGIGGDQIGTSVTTFGVVSRLDLVKQARPALVFVMIGINNMWDKNDPVELTIEKYEEMVPKLKAAVPDAKIVLQSVLPTSGKINYTNAPVQKLNARIKELAAENSLVWSDVGAIMMDEKGELRSEFTNDGCHLTKQGYAVWLKHLQQQIPGLL